VGSAAGDALTTGSRNISIGSDALGAGVTTSDCVAIGYNALLLNKGDNNVTVGNYALDALTTGINNVAIGSNAGSALTTGSNNFAMGSGALQVATTVSDNVAIGKDALVSKTSSGNGNIAIGTSALYRATTASTSTAVGYQSQFGSAAVTAIGNSSLGYNSMVNVVDGGYNSAMGINALYSLTSGAQNTGVGTEALYALITTSSNTGVGVRSLGYTTVGANNTAIGYYAGAYKGITTAQHTTSGDGNVYIGYQSRASGNSVTNETVIGTRALGLGSNTAVIGATSQSSATIYGLVNAPGGIYTDNITSLTGNIYITSPAATTYIGDWDGANNGTHIDVDDDLATITIGAQGGGTNLYGTLVTDSAVTIGDTVTIGGGLGLVNSASVTLGTTAASQVITSLTKTVYRSAEFFVQASTAGGAYEALKIAAIHDGTNTWNTQYGVIRSGITLGAYTTSIGGGGGAQFRLLVTPTTANTTYKVMITALPV
jgi:hypothetical protein